MVPGYFAFPGDANAFEILKRRAERLSPRRDAPRKP